MRKYSLSRHRRGFPLNLACGFSPRTNASTFREWRRIRVYKGKILIPSATGRETSCSAPRPSPWPHRDHQRGRKRCPADCRPVCTSTTTICRQRPADKQIHTTDPNPGIFAREVVRPIRQGTFPSQRVPGSYQRLSTAFRRLGRQLDRVAVFPHGYALGCSGGEQFNGDRVPPPTSSSFTMPLTLTSSPMPKRRFVAMVAPKSRNTIRDIRRFRSSPAAVLAAERSITRYRSDFGDKDKKATHLQPRNL